jgi:hypothetical protein
VPDVSRAQGSRLDDLSSDAPHAELEHSPRLHWRTVIRTAWRILRERPRRVAGTAAVVFGITAWVNAVIEVTIIEPADSLAVDAVAGIFAATVSTYGIVFYAGLLDLVLRSYLEGKPDLQLRHALSQLPLTRLLLADLVLVVASAAGALLLVIPGIIVFTLLCLVGPLIVSQDLKVFAGLRRSYHLVRPHFWMTLCLVTIPFLIEDQLLHGIDLTLYGHRLLGAFCISALIGATIGAAVGLLEVVLAHELREHEQDDEANTKTESAAQ